MVLKAISAFILFSTFAIHLFGQQMPDLMELPVWIDDGDQRPEILLNRRGFIVSYNEQWKIPNWVAYELTAWETDGSNQLKGFVPDPDLVESGVETADNSDYNKSGYDRGHMAPAGDMKWSSRARQECYYLSNILPQNQSLNSGKWNQLEQMARTWANESGSVWIVCGPIVDDGYMTIGQNSVVVPQRLFKVLLKRNGRKDYKAIGFIFPNEKCEGSLMNYSCTVDEVEEITGLDFFSLLPDDIENRIEAQKIKFF